MTEKEKPKKICYADELTPQQIQEFRIAFNMFDVDGDGDIDPDELATCFKFFGQNPSKDELLEMIKEVDEDCSMQIEFDEFLELMGKAQHGVDQQEQLKKSFKIFDKDGDNTIDPENLLDVLNQPTMKDKRLSDNPNSLLYKVFDGLNKYQIEEMIREVDTTGKGEISYDEYLGLMNEIQAVDSKEEETEQKE